MTKRISLTATVVLLLGLVANAQADIIIDTYTRVDSTSLGQTESGQFIFMYKKVF